MADIVIVGAGPVGLWTAIQVKKRDPRLDIVMYERHQEYKRSHVLKLEYLSMLLYAKNGSTQAEREFYKDVTGKSLSDIFRKMASSTFVPTNHLESALKTHSDSLGIKIIYEKIESPEALLQAHPECNIFIAADGAHSPMRSALMNDRPVRKEDLQYVAEVKYKAQGATKPLDLLGDQYKANKLLSNMVFEYVGRERNGATSVTLRFFIDENTYAAIPEAEFKKPLTLDLVLNADDSDDPRFPPALAKDIQTYLNVRESVAGENYLPNSGALTKLPLSVYAADKFGITQKSKSWFFVGDAAMRVPYFRSLNAGIIIGSQLAYILTRDSLSNEAKVSLYNTCRPLDIAWEFTVARSKDMGLKAYDIFRKVSRGLPWEIIKWDEATELNFRNRKHPSFAPENGPKS